MQVILQTLIYSLNGLRAEIVALAIMAFVVIPVLTMGLTCGERIILALKGAKYEMEEVILPSHSFTRLYDMQPHDAKDAVVAFFGTEDDNGLWISSPGIHETINLNVIKEILPSPVFVCNWPEVEEPVVQQPKAVRKVRYTQPWETKVKPVTRTDYNPGDYNRFLKRKLWEARFDNRV